MNTQWEERIRTCESLPALPPAAVRVLELAQQEDIGLDDLAHAISTDPALSASLLRSVNSTF
jgi:HD-like signal output (HDOD) protein